MLTEERDWDLLIVTFLKRKDVLKEKSKNVNSNFIF